MDIKKLKKDKAAGSNGLTEGTRFDRADALNHQPSLDEKSLPYDWTISSISQIFKKSDPVKT